MTNGARIAERLGRFVRRGVDAHPSADVGDGVFLSNSSGLLTGTVLALLLPLVAGSLTPLLLTVGSLTAVFHLAVPLLHGWFPRGPVRLAQQSASTIGLLFFSLSMDPRVHIEMFFLTLIATPFVFWGREERLGRGLGTLLPFAAAGIAQLGLLPSPPPSALSDDELLTLQWSTIVGANCLLVGPLFLLERARLRAFVKARAVRRQLRTERDQAEALEEHVRRARAAAMTGALISDVVERLEEPLRRLSNEVDRLAASLEGVEVLDDEVTADLEEVPDAVDDTRSAANRILELWTALSLVGAGGDEHRPVVRSVREAVEATRPLWHGRYDVAVDVPDEAALGEGSARLVPAMVALLENACQAMDSVPEAERRGRGIRVVAYGTETEATLGVIDEGSGLTESARAQAFNPFFTTRGPGGGVGLGLATVEEVALRHDGTAWIEPRDRGCAVWMRLRTSPRPRGCDRATEP